MMKAAEPAPPCQSAAPREGQQKGARVKCLCLEVSLDRDLIPPGKIFAWLALCQTLGLPLAGTSLEVSLGHACCTF